MTQQQTMPDREREGQPRPDQGQQWDPNKQGGGQNPGQEKYPGQEQQRDPGRPGIPSGEGQ